MAGGSTLLKTKAIPNLIQGVSQQAVQLRKDSQCASQFDCINSVADGCVARPGADVMAYYDLLDFTGAACYEVYRGPDEHYLVVITKDALRAFSLTTGIECTVTSTDTDANYYLSRGIGNRRDILSFQSLNDFLFIANNAVSCSMTTDVTEVRPPEALLFFRAGAYSMQVSVTVTYASVDYEFHFTTADNSVAANGAKIATNYMAAQMYKGLTGDSSTKPIGATASVGSDTATASAGTLVAQGFSVEIKGNLIRIWRAGDTNSFTLKTSDGESDTFLIGIKDTIPAFGSLPLEGFPGFRVAIAGAAQDANKQYYVHYVSPLNQNGFWEECAGPGVHTTIDPSTMPVTLVNTDVNTFELRVATWDTRLAGDEDTAPDPSFIGRPIVDMFYEEGRMGFVSEAGVTWSKTRNPFDVWPDTTQTVLATDRIDVQIAATNVTSVLEYAFTVDESTFFWSQKAQFRASAGLSPNAVSPLSADTVRVKQNSDYEFSSSCRPQPIGKSVYFVGRGDDSYTGGDWVSLAVIPLQNGLPLAEAVLTEHVPSYVPAPVRQIVGDPIRHFLFMRSDAVKSNLWLYNSIIQGQDILQSAWNTWRLPVGCNIVWGGLFRASLYLLVTRALESMLLRIPLSAAAVDPGGDYLTRLDLRVDNSQCSMLFLPTFNQTVITLPYGPLDGEGTPTVVGKHGPYRGKIFKVHRVVENQLTVDGDLTSIPFYAGFPPVAERTESPFFLRADAGFTPVDDLTVFSFRVDHTFSVYYRMEVLRTNGRMTQERYDSRTAGNATSSTGVPIPEDGHLAGDVNSDNTAVSIRLVNDSPFPSRWQIGQYKYTVTERSLLT